MPLNTEALKRKVAKAIDKMPVTVTVFRHKKDAWNEPCGQETVATITGQLNLGARYKGKNAFVDTQVSNAGRTLRGQGEKLMVVIDEESRKIQPGDWFALDGVDYEIVDLGNSLEVYFDFSLERL